MWDFLNFVVGIADLLYRLIFRPRQVAVAVALGWLAVIALGDARWSDRSTKGLALVCLGLWAWGWLTDAASDRAG